MPYHSSTSSSTLEPCGKNCFRVSLSSSSCSPSTGCSSSVGTKYESDRPIPKFVSDPQYYSPPIAPPPREHHQPPVIIRDHRVNPEASCSFRTIFTPVNSLHPSINPIDNSVRITLRRKNRTVTLQWEPFTGVMAVNGIGYISATQSIDNLPPYPIEQTIRLLYNGTVKQGFIQVNPSDTDAIRFYLDLSGLGANSVIGDSFTIFGGTITWIMDEKERY